MITLIDFTLFSTTLMVDNPAVPKPLNTMFPSEQVIEIASRLCYNSLDKLGTNTNFIGGLIKAGHMDVLEHAYSAFDVVFYCETLEETVGLELRLSQMAVNHRHMGELTVEVIDYQTYEPRYGVEVRLGANLRTWLEIISNPKLINNNIAYQLMSHDLCHTLHGIAPNIFHEYYEKGISPNSTAIVSDFKIMENMRDTFSYSPYIREILPILTQMGVEVIPLAYSHRFYSHDTVDPFKQMAFLVSGASRSFSHQHVRHRLLSFSQMSQRYVDFVNKQDGGFVYPPGQLTDEQHLLLANLFKNSRDTYEALRATGMKKEDARMVLPNAAETSMVFSGTEKGLQHYFNLRTAKDAQQEIREIAMATQTLYELAYREKDI